MRVQVRRQPRRCLQLIEPRRRFDPRLDGGCLMAHRVAELRRSTRRSSSSTSDCAMARSLPRPMRSVGSTNSVCPDWLALWTMPGTSAWCWALKRRDDIAVIAHRVVPFAQAQGELLIGDQPVQADLDAAVQGAGALPVRPSARGWPGRRDLPARFEAAVEPRRQAAPGPGSAVRWPTAQGTGIRRRSLERLRARARTRTSACVTAISSGWLEHRPLLTPAPGNWRRPRDTPSHRQGQAARPATLPRLVDER